MSLTKKVDGMAYEASGSTKVKDGKGAMLSIAGQLSTLSLIWLLVRRHKVGLLAIGNIVLVLNWTVPEWPTIVKSLL